MGRSTRLAAAALSAAGAAGTAYAHERRAVRSALAGRGELLGAARIAALVEPLYARPAPRAQAPGPVTRELLGRLLPEDVAELESRLTGDARQLWEERAPEDRGWLTLALVAHYNVEGALERTGLTAAEPPGHVHAMGRGPFAAGGDPATADLVVECLEEAGFPLEDWMHVLDFGCSSGRVLRVLAAYNPKLHPFGCDPNQPAIEWAGFSLPAQFFLSPTVPPIDYPDAYFEIAYAISIWSHFDAGSARAWLAELHRLIKPGGALLLTAHGLDSMSGFLRDGGMSELSAAQTTIELLREGHQFYDVFGDQGDWGVSHPGWGNGYMTLMWLAREATPDWAIRLYREGALGANQDVLVLERRP